MSYTRFLNEKDLKEIDPFVQRLIESEKDRQRRKIILIPSESICPEPVLEALASPFSNIYAEGYPAKDMLEEDEAALLDMDFQHARHRRYFDRRFYKGCEYANLIETLARRRVQELFATPANPPEKIFANIQALSGAAANNTIYSALLKPGEAIMGMSLMHGGHLTHGSEFNRSGKTYKAAAYEVSHLTEKLDYDEIFKKAHEHKPKLLIAGYTSYPWAPDWKKFREIADSVGAYLLADVAHPAGLIVAGVYPNPVDYADVLTFTTHKTLLGPRGAVIMTASREIAEKIDQAVFPGEQGGPHVNTFAALAAAFKIAGTKEFKDTQKKIVENARHFAAVLERNGLTLAYGGTDTHLLVLNLRNLKSKSGYPLKGDTAVRILDIAGIVANKNTIPGDETTADASGVRMGTPWITQRGISSEGIEELAAVIADLIKNIHAFSYRGTGGTLPRGKIELENLERANKRVQNIVETLVPQGDKNAGFHNAGTYVDFQKSKDGAYQTDEKNAAAFNAEYSFFKLRGHRAEQFLEQAGTNTIAGLKNGEVSQTLFFDADGKLLAPSIIIKLEKDERGCSRFILGVKREHRASVKAWLTGFSDGYLLFDRDDIFRKVEGPVAIEELPEETVCTMHGGVSSSSSFQAFEIERGSSIAELFLAAPSLFDLQKPYFIGQSFLRNLTTEKENAGKTSIKASPGPASSPKGSSEPARETCLYGEHLKLTESFTEFAGWKMPVRYEGTLEEHRTVRDHAGLFDVTHMGVIEISGEHSERFLDIVSSNYVPWLRDGESQYSYLLAPDGSVIDDVMIYRVSRKRYILVVNAANAEKDLEWLKAVNSGDALLDQEYPLKRAPGPVSIRDLKDPSSGKDRLVDIAIQGPASLSILETLVSNDGSRRDIKMLEKTKFVFINLAGLDVVAARTGYTGEKFGFELLVHPEKAPNLWNMLLNEGSQYGLKPAGLGARDSLRIEAGLPLYGHELAGSLNISPLEAGFEPYVKFHKPFFIGRDSLLKRETRSAMTIIRSQKLETGTRMSKPGDIVIAKRAQKTIGHVTSCALNRDGIQVGMAYIDKTHSREGTKLGILSAASPKSAGASVGESFPVYDDAVVVCRFPRECR